MASKIEDGVTRDLYDPQAARQLSADKIMASVFWDSEEVTHVIFFHMV
jgi:hypothetical protein